MKRERCVLTPWANLHSEVVLARSADFLYVDASGYSNADPPVKVVKDI